MEGRLPDDECSCHYSLNSLVQIWRKELTIEIETNWDETTPTQNPTSQLVRFARMSISLRAESWDSQTASPSHGKSHQSLQKGFGTGQVSLISEKADMIPWWGIASYRMITSAPTEPWFCCVDRASELYSIWIYLTCTQTSKFKSKMVQICVWSHPALEMDDYRMPSLGNLLGCLQFLMRPEGHLMIRLVQTLSLLEKRCFRNHLSVAWQDLQSEVGIRKGL